MSPFDKIVIEQHRGTYNPPVDDGDLFTYPLEGLTFFFDYGYIPDFPAEDGNPTNVFVGTGDLNTFMVIDAPTLPGGKETKVLYQVTLEEFHGIIAIHHAIVITTYFAFMSDEAVIDKLRLDRFLRSHK
jgi:hypothetical protein